MSSERPKMYLVVDSTLGMDKGKLCAQTGHAVEDLVRRLEKKPTASYIDWCSKYHTKVVLKGDGALLRSLRTKYPETVAVIDAGLTQIPANSLTVVGFPPLVYQPPELAQLKLL
jgi:peptidyl-tRNA hydrolase